MNPAVIESLESLLALPDSASAGTVNAAIDRLKAACDDMREHDMRLGYVNDDRERRNDEK